MGDTFVKLSNISRECSFSKLKARLGDFEKRGDDVSIEQRRDGLDPDEETGKDLWRVYNKERTNYFRTKLTALRELREAQKAERQDLRQRYKELRAGLFKDDWRGRGRELNCFRSIYAFSYKKARLDLAERHDEQLAELKSRYPQRFPSYSRWAKERNSEAVYQMYCCPEDAVLPPEQSGRIEVPDRQHFDLRDYSARKGAGFSVLYCRGGGYTADFSDTGKRIILNKDKLDETSVAAALQLANQKWGATQINGSAEYKELCVSVAVKYNLKLANPDLAAEVERRRNALRHGGGMNVTEAEIAALHLADNPKIYLNPRTDNQQYKGEVVHVDTERGFCVQRVGKQSLFIHRIERLEAPPNHGENVRISYSHESEKAKVERQEKRQRTLGL